MRRNNKMDDGPKIDFNNPAIVNMIKAYESMRHPERKQLEIANLKVKCLNRRMKKFYRKLQKGKK